MAYEKWNTSQKMDKGVESEINVKLTLKRLTFAGYIEGFSQSKAYSADDMNGVDFRIFIKTPSGYRIDVPVQVKSCRANRDDFRWKAKQYNQAAIWAIIGQGDNIENQIKSLIEHVRSLWRTP